MLFRYLAQIVQIFLLNSIYHYNFLGGNLHFTVSNYSIPYIMRADHILKWNFKIKCIIFDTVQSLLYKISSRDRKGFLCMKYVVDRCWWQLYSNVIQITVIDFPRNTGELSYKIFRILPLLISEGKPRQNGEFIGNSSVGRLSPQQNTISVSKTLSSREKEFHISIL